MTTSIRQAPEEARWVFVPGTLCDERVFDDLVAQLGDRTNACNGYRVPPLDDPRRSRIAERLLAQVKGRLNVVGFSLGAQIAMEMARRAPSRVGRLILISTTGRADVPEMASTRRQQVDEAGRLGSGQFVRRYLWAKYVSPVSLDNPRLERLVVDMADRTPATAFAAQAELAIARPCSLSDLSEIQVPLLMVNGADDVLTPPELGAELAAAAWCGHHDLIPGAGHFVLAERPGETADAILKWLAQPPPC